MSAPDRDLLKLVCVERHKASGRVGVGYVRGFKLRRGALASSIAHDAHNVIAVGTNDDDLLACVERLRQIGGGLVVCDGGTVVARAFNASGEQVARREHQLLSSVEMARGACRLAVRVARQHPSDRSHRRWVKMQCDLARATEATASENRQGRRPIPGP